METIERKTLINKSGLGFWCVNAVQGCSHGCRYPCHAFLLARRYGRVSDYAAWREPKLVGNALALLDMELRRKRGIDSVHLSLTTDPFMVGHPEVTELSLQIIERVNREGIPCSVLTKGILPPELADVRRFHPDNTYGISLVSLDEGFRARWEPGASPYAVRVAAARALHQGGRRTRVHIEPYPTPVFVKQDVNRVLEQVDFVEHVYFGGWNYNAAAREFPGCARFYEEQASAVRRFCDARGIACDAG
ncbi:MAG: radical SAM protein [Deltaproteobacteria bacterium HGW-Deltaproteobacteria-20]|nr:MAG: radical SAM protein [Deltaproteobacteria bacterium HGW-Deltaproteobacteria-20]